MLAPGHGAQCIGRRTPSTNGQATSNHSSLLPFWPRGRGRSNTLPPKAQHKALASFVCLVRRQRGDHQTTRQTRPAPGCACCCGGRAGWFWLVVSPGRCAAHNTPSVVRYSTGQFPDSHTHTRAAAGQREREAFRDTRENLWSRTPTSEGAAWSGPGVSLLLPGVFQSGFVAGGCLSARFRLPPATETPHGRSIWDGCSKAPPPGGREGACCLSCRLASAEGRRGPGARAGPGDD